MAEALLRVEKLGLIVTVCGRTPEEQAQGLMFRESLTENTGMLFPFPDKGVHRFWMKNTMIPLDMIWMDADGKVIFVSADTPPCKADPCPSYGPDSPAASARSISTTLNGWPLVRAASASAVSTSFIFPLDCATSAAVIASS